MQPLCPARCRVLSFAVATVLAAATATVGALGDGGRPLWHPARLVFPASFGDQGLPPPAITPALFRKFQFLLAGYQAVGADTEFTFAEWLVLNDITDPRELIGLMWLWWSHGANRHAI